MESLSQNLGYVYVHGADGGVTRVGMIVDSATDIFSEEGVVPLGEFIGGK